MEVFTAQNAMTANLDELMKITGLGNFVICTVRKVVLETV